MWTEKGEGDVSLGVISRKEEGRDSVDREGEGQCGQRRGREMSHWE